jgi:hypothetical protein
MEIIDATLVKRDDRWWMFAAKRTERLVLKINH